MHEMRLILVRLLLGRLSDVMHLLSQFCSYFFGDDGIEFGLIKWLPCICAPGHPKGEVPNIYLETEAFCWTSDFNPLPVCRYAFNVVL